MPSLPRFLLPASVLVLVAGCDAFYEALEIPNPEKAKAEARAIGAACRHSGRSLEDCFYLHPDADKAAVFEGWKAMNDYMLEKELPSVPPQLVPLDPTAIPQPLARNEPIIPQPQKQPQKPAEETPKQ